MFYDTQHFFNVEAVKACKKKVSDDLSLPFIQVQLSTIAMSGDDFQDLSPHIADLAFRSKVYKKIDFGCVTHQPLTIVLEDGQFFEGSRLENVSASVTDNGRAIHLVWQIQESNQAAQFWHAMYDHSLTLLFRQEQLDLGLKTPAQASTAAKIMDVVADYADSQQKLCDDPKSGVTKITLQLNGGKPVTVAERGKKRTRKPVRRGMIHGK